MTQLIDKKIANIIEQSDDIAKQVKSKNWETVEILSKQRQDDLERFFKSPVHSSNAKSIETMIRKILTIDHQLVEFIEDEKQKTFDNYACLQNNNKANLTYKNVALLK